MPAASPNFAATPAVALPRPPSNSGYGTAGASPYGGPSAAAGYTANLRTPAMHGIAAPASLQGQIAAVVSNAEEGQAPMPSKEAPHEPMDCN